MTNNRQRSNTLTLLSVLTCKSLNCNYKVSHWYFQGIIVGGYRHARGPPQAWFTINLQTLHTINFYPFCQTNLSSLPKVQ